MSKWYLRSNGYMISKCDYQEIAHMKADRAIENGDRLVFIKKDADGNEIDSRVYWIARTSDMVCCENCEYAECFDDDSDVWCRELMEWRTRDFGCVYGKAVKR